MTLSLRAINSPEIRLLNYSHFSKISILNDTSQSENKLILDCSIRQAFDKPQRVLEDYEGENWSEAVCSPRTKNSGKSLNIDSDSVLNFSLASVPKMSNMDSDLQLFIGDNHQLTLEELNAYVSLLREDFAQVELGENLTVKVGVEFIPQTVKLNQALTRFNNDPKGKATTKCVLKFVDLCNKLIKEVWLPTLSECNAVMKTTLQTLEQYRDQYIKVELKSKPEGQLDLVVREWSMLNYFPAVLVKSLNFKVLFGRAHIVHAQDRESVQTHELNKILFVTMALEVSKTFIKIMGVLIELDACKFLDNTLVTQVMTILLEYTVETYTGEIMIGIDQVVKIWITEKSKTDPHCKPFVHQWVRGILYDYKMRFHNDMSTFTFSSEDEEQVAELMFDKCDLGKIFVEEILRFTQTEKEESPALENTIGWLTIFRDDCGATSALSDETCNSQLEHTALLSLERPRAVGAAPCSVHSVRTQYTKRAAVKEWAHNNKVRISDEFNKIKQKFNAFFNMHSQPAMITSVRYYNAVASLQSRRMPFPGDTTTFREEQRAQMEKLTRKMYKTEKRGKRKRDALRVIIS